MGSNDSPGIGHKMMSVATITLAITSMGLLFSLGGCVHMDRRGDYPTDAARIEESAASLVRVELLTLVNDLRAMEVSIDEGAAVGVGEPLAYFTLSDSPRRPPLGDWVSHAPAGSLVPILADESVAGVVVVESERQVVSELSSDSSQYMELSRGTVLLREILGPEAEIRPVMSMVDFVIGLSEGGAETIVFCGLPRGMYRSFSVNGRDVLLMHPYTGEEAVDALRDLR